MADEDKLSKTEKPTSKKLDDARKKGNTANSKEIPTVAMLLGTLAIFYVFGGRIILNMENIMKDLIYVSGSFDVTQRSMPILLKQVMTGIFYIMAPLLFLPIIAILSIVAQVGFIFSTESMAPSLSKLNPINGVKKFFAPTALADLVKSISKLSVIGYMAYTAINKEMDMLGRLTDMEVGSILYFLGGAAFRVLLATSWVLIILAALDYIFQKWNTRKGLMMTKQEVKEERKDMEGDPIVKQRIRTIQYQMARQRMMREVPTATAVITNPTHFAIAVKYEQGKMNTPIVVAKGANLIAARIKEIAREHKVPIVENKPLARMLWRTVDIGKEIPASLYKAVAEVLAYVYRLRTVRG